MEYSGIDAAIWTWKNLWKKDSTHVKHDILDVIMRDDGKKISGWIFTSTDGSIKSKSNFRWNNASIIERCTKDDGKTISAHEYVQRGWRSLELNGIDFVHTNSPAVIVLGRINNPVFYIEQTYSLDPGDIVAKHVTNRLCYDTIKGTGTLPVIGGNLPPLSDDLPTHRLRNKDKSLNRLAETKMKEFVHLLENRARVNVRKLVCVFLVEIERAPSEYSSNNMRLWLHHVSSINADKKGSAGELDTKEKTGGKGSWELRSEASATITPTTISGQARGAMMRCNGDFCSFVEDEEAALYDADEGSVTDEAKRALRRHRRLSDDEANGVEGTLGSPDEKSALHRSTSSNVLIGSQAFKVPQKIIVLVRNDMQLLEDAIQGDALDPSMSDSVPWPHLVQHWWWRIGKAVYEGKSKRIIIPQSSGHQINNAIYNPSTDSVQDSKEDAVLLDPRARLARIASNLSEASSPQLTSENLSGLQKQEKLTSNGGNSFDLDRSVSTRETDSKLGDLSWYYSEANVCERCYQVYRDIERKRKLNIRQKAINAYVNPYDTMYQSLPDQAKTALSAVPLTERDRYLEARKQNVLRRQKYSNNRLAQAKLDGNSQEDSAYSVADMSTIDTRDPNCHHRKKFTSPAGAPKGVIPPTPWNLQDESVASEYAVMGSTFIKNIRNKAHAISMQVQDIHRQQEIELNKKFGIENTVDNDFKWEAMTGKASRKGQPNAAREIGPNPLHKSMSAGEVSRKKKKVMVKAVTKQFDPNRLMHQWQRDMQAEREHRRQEDVIWRDDVELQGRLQKLQNTGIVTGVVPIKKPPRKKGPSYLAPEPIIVPSSSARVTDTKSYSSSSPSPSMDNIFRSTTTSLSSSELGLTRKNSLHTIIESDDELDRHGDPSPKNQNKSMNNSSLPPRYVSSQKGHSLPNAVPVTSRLPPEPVPNALGKERAHSNGFDDDDDDDEGIGWSPFVVPLA